jgi:hypothetical protein
MSRRDSGIQHYIFAQVEEVGYLVQVLFHFRLTREAFFPGPVHANLVHKRENVNPALAIRPSTGIAVPIPCL